MSERQLPADHRSTIRQGFAASLLLTSLLFFWNFLAVNELSRGAFFLYRGGLSPTALVTGPPVAKSVGDRGPIVKEVGDRPLQGPLCKFWLRNFAKNTCRQLIWR